MTSTGYLVAIKITGYVAFLTQTEIEHAQAITDDLLNALIKQISSPLTFAKTEGETIFLHAPSGGFQQAQTFIELLEQLYIGFAQAQEAMQHNTTCACQACQMIPMLGLKMVAHHGEFQQVSHGSQDDLTGADVIWLRRLQDAELDVPNAPAYACLTTAAITTLDLQGITADLSAFSWQENDLGEQTGIIYDLQPAWEHARTQQQVMVDTDKTWLSMTVDLPVSPTVAWEYITAPEYRRYWLQSDSVIIQGTKNGRVGVGSTHVCAHGNLKIYQAILDWKPFHYFTVDVMMILNGIQRQTVQLETLSDGATRVHWLASPIRGRSATAHFLWRFMAIPLKPVLLKQMQRGGAQIKQIVIDTYKG